MPNRLAHETSPYLLQHKDNPVDWYPWGAEALERSRQEDKPIFLSIGYSACHWCHVMEHESFENATIARLLNEYFVPIKVDREERPDLDQIYMNAVQIMTSGGGWPMSVFLTPDLEPFYGGTYWPPTSRMGMPGFAQVLEGVQDAWQNRREQAREQAAKLTAHMRQFAAATADDESLDFTLLQHAEATLERIFDFNNGGFGGAPKFPHATDVVFLLRMWRRSGRDGLLEMVNLTLGKMAAGGIYDQLGGGFHRYSVDARWLVPHFEKMLYDNALLSGCYTEAYLATGIEDYQRVVRETLDYVLREMQHDEGGFFSTQDADSEGVEGKFFVWTPAEVREALGAEAAEIFCRVYDVTEAGNFEGKNILNLPKTIDTCAKMLNRDATEMRADLAVSRQKLLDVREARVHPGLDDKVIVAWNGLMIDALARAAVAIGEPRYLDAATRSAEFIWQNLRQADGRLLHTWRDGQARFDAYLDDYSSLLVALVSLYEAGFDEHWIDRAAELASGLLDLFFDDEDGGFFYTARDHEQLILRQKDLTDGAVPGGSALATNGLLRLGRLTGRSDFVDAAVRTMHAAADRMRQSPTASGQMLLDLDWYLGPTHEIVVLGAADEIPPVLNDLRQHYLPKHVLASRGDDGQSYESEALTGLFSGKQSQGGKPTVFVCENFACREPIVGREAACELWDRMSKPTD